MNAFQAQLPQFEALGIQVIGLNIDHKFVQKAFAEQQKLGYPLVADPNREVSTQLGTLLEEVAGVKQVNLRGVLLIDHDMTVRWKFGVDTATQPNVTEVLAEAEKVVGSK